MSNFKTKQPYASPMKITSILLACFFLLSGNTASAQQCNYDLPGNDHLTEDQFLPPIPRRNYTMIRVASRLVPWSDYLGIKDSEKSIAPNRIVWEVLTKFCRPDAEGKTRYFFEAVDGVTRERLTPMHIQTTTDLHSIAPWAADYTCSFPGPE